ncbi:Fucose 4-O-acetylase [Lentibacillus halodurans]|uniref:Fucose 4-O-acetylase n=1 Tax=Lentibacillus halodurans TaxID=237679 RepID=A0A1I0XB84_9BACI|nr:acyltransferase family protein [Lentibacillus halodurans]SFA97600.1 Fucose 4-O-acetylase [Lentibacillus halodurans]
MERNAYFDNAKLISIFLVVFGHVIQPFVDESAGVNTLYLWIYTFHMPAFILLAGFFAKGSGNIKYIAKLAHKLLVPYLIFQVIYTGYYFLIGKDGWQAEMFYPHWSLWFLFSLFSWHILLVLFKKVPPAMGLSISIGIGLIVGYFGEIGHTFSLSRTFVFFPFFLMGYWLTKTQVMWLKRIQLRAAAVVVMTAVAVAIYFAPDFNTGWLLASKSYSSLGLPEYGIIARLLVYVTSALMAASVLAWMPQKRSRLTVLGTRTLYVYLLHGFFVQFFRESDLFVINSAIDLLGLAVMSALIVLVLSSRPVKGIWQPVVEGKMSILKNKYHQRHGRKRENASA